jgi:hypothetical protein
MKIQQKKTEIDPTTLEIQIHAEVLPDEVQSIFDRIFQGIQKDLKMPGFPRGQVPLETVRRQSQGRVRDQAYREILQEFGKKALTETGFYPEEGMHGWKADSSNLIEGQSFVMENRFHFPSPRTDEEIFSELKSLPSGDAEERRIFDFFSLARRSSSKSLRETVAESVFQLAQNLRRDMENPAIHSPVTIMAVWEQCQDLCKMVLELNPAHVDAQTLSMECQKHIQPRV